MREQKHLPLERFGGDQKGVDARATYIKTLLRWGVILWNPTIKLSSHQYKFIKDPSKWRNAATPLKLKQGQELYEHGTQIKP